MRKLDKHTARATARVEREAPDSKDTATFLRRARAASLKAKGSRFGALAEEEYDKIAPVIACTLPALTDSIPERKRRELAGEVTSELQVVGKAASIAIQTWVRNNDKTKARAEEREKNIGWIKRLFTAWRVSHTERTERRAERKEDGEDDSEEDEPVEIQLSDVTMHPKGTPAPASSVEARVFEERVDLSNNMTWRQMIGVGVRNVVLARGELDKLEGPKYAARRAELRREEAARARDRQAAAASQNEAEESDATEEEETRERTTRRGRPRGGMKVAARICERQRREIGRVRLNILFLSHPVSFPFLFSLQHPLFFYFPGKTPGKPSNFPGSEPSLRLVWAQNQPNFRPNRQNAGNFAHNPCTLPCTYF